MPLTHEQQNALTAVRATYRNLSFPFGTVASLDERARPLDPESLPTDATARVEIAPPCPHAHPLLDSGALKVPERVPIYFYALRNDPPRADPGPKVADTHVIFYIHGGGNVLGHPADPPFARFFIQLLRAAAEHSGDARKCVLISPTYRLATVPENAFPAALQDLVAAYDYVLGKGYKASNIVIAGDSAGGNHAVVLTHLILQSDRPSPRGVVPIAPSQLYDHLSEYAKAQANTDIMDPSCHDLLSKAYIGDSGVSRRDPLVSGPFIPFTASWPKTLILVGTGDQLIDASRELEKRLVAQKRPVELVEYDERPHGWWVMPHIFPDDVQDAVQRVAQFVLN